MLGNVQLMLIFPDNSSPVLIGGWEQKKKAEAEQNWSKRTSLKATSEDQSLSIMAMCVSVTKSPVLISILSIQSFVLTMLTVGISQY